MAKTKAAPSPYDALIAALDQAAQAARACREEYIRSTEITTEYVSNSKAAVLLGCSPSQISKLTREGKITKYAGGYKVSELREYAANPRGTKKEWRI